MQASLLESLARYFLRWRFWGHFWKLNLNWSILIKESILESWSLMLQFRVWKVSEEVLGTISFEYQQLEVFIFSFFQLSARQVPHPKRLRQPHAPSPSLRAPNLPDITLRHPWWEDILTVIQPLFLPLSSQGHLLSPCQEHCQNQEIREQLAIARHLPLSPSLTKQKID